MSNVEGENSRLSTLRKRRQTFTPLKNHDKRCKQIELHKNLNASQSDNNINKNSKEQSPKKGVVINKNLNTSQSDNNINKNSKGKSPRKGVVINQNTKSQIVEKVEYKKANYNNKFKTNGNAKINIFQRKSLNNTNNMSEVEQLKTELARRDAEVKRVQGHVNILMAEKGALNKQIHDLTQTQVRQNQNNNQFPNLNEFGEVLAITLATQLQQLNTQYKANIKKPQFKNHKNPKQFLEEIDKYLKLKNVRVEDHLVAIEEILEEGQVKIWLDNKLPCLNSLEQFKREFLNQFYSIPIQIEFKTRWLNSRFDKNMAYQEYFYTQQNAAKYLEPLMSPFETNFSIIRQFPQNIQDNLATIDFSNTEKIMRTLCQLDVNRSVELAERDKQIGPVAQRYQVNAFGFDQTTQAQNANNNWRERGKNRYGGYQSGGVKNMPITLPDMSVPPPNAYGSVLPGGQTVNNNMINNKSFGDTQQNHTMRHINQIQSCQTGEGNFVDFVEEMVENINGEGLLIGDARAHKGQCPQIKISIGDIKLRALLDTGSQVSAMSETQYNEFSKVQLFEELPVTTTNVITAITKKLTPIKRQIYVTFKIGDETFCQSMLVIPGLNQDMLLGTDWCQGNKVIINYCDGKIWVESGLIRNDLVIFEENLDNKKLKVNSVGMSENCDMIIEDINDNPLVESELISCEESTLVLVNDAYEESNDDVIIHHIEQAVGIQPCNDDKIRLSDDQQAKFQFILDKFHDVFSDQPGCSKSYQHKLRIIPGKPVVKKSYPVPHALRELVHEEVQRMHEEGVIELSESDVCNPMRIVKKSDGKVRLCLDARFINVWIEGDNEKPPLISEVVQKFHGKRVFTLLDLTSGYWQIPLHPESRKYTAFLNGTTLYQFCRSPFGIKTSGSAFVRALNIAFGTDFDSFLTYYVDDLLVASNNINEHLDHLQLIFQRLKDHGYTLKLSKAKFCKSEVPFLGYIISEQGYKPNPDKLKDLINFCEPSNKKELQSFLGVCNYYHHFSANHASFVDPLRELLKKDSIWTWTQQHKQAFRDLKANFVKITQLYHYDLDLEFRVQTDASDRGVSGILYQIDGEAQPRLISVISRCLQSAEVNYNTTEKELLAIVYALIKFRVFLIGRPFKIITDHQALTFLNSSPFHTARLARWNLLAQEYQFEIVHCNGTDNQVADFFSRHPEGRFCQGNNTKLMIPTLAGLIKWDESSPYTDVGLGFVNFIELDASKGMWINNMTELQRQDNLLMNFIENRDKKGHGSRYRQFRGVWFHWAEDCHGWKIIVPNVIQEELVAHEHERLCHAGVYKTLGLIRRNFWFKGVERVVKRVVSSCDICQRVKHLNRCIEGDYDMVRASRPSELVTVDFYGPLPGSVGKVQYIFVMIDAFTKHVKLYPLVKANTNSVLKRVLENYVHDVGRLPDKILADNGTQFTSHKWRSELEKNGVSVKFCSIRHPQSNPTERVMRELGRMFRVLCSERHSSWAKYIKQIESCLNYATHCSTGFSPYELQFGVCLQDEVRKLFEYPGSNNNVQPEKMLAQAKLKLIKSFENRKRHQQGNKPFAFNVGDSVLVRVPHLSNSSDKVTQKFFHLYEGPYKIKTIIGNNAFALQDLETGLELTGTYNRISLRPYVR